jgi:peptidoglycan hydrolase-like protein with peptidoglycan-binding domain
VVGAGVGGYAGHYETEPGGLAAAPANGTSHRAGGMVTEQSSSTVRSAQQALNDRGFNVGSVDGVWGPNTENAVRDFQRAQGLQQTGTLDQATLAALGVSGNAAAAPGPSYSNGNMNNRTSGTAANR